MKQKIILASTSKAKQEVLNQIGINFEAISSNYEENMELDLKPKQLAQTLARGKALEVANRIESGLVIGADTFIVYKRKKIGKPKSVEAAQKLLKSLSGKTLKVYHANLDCTQNGYWLYHSGYHKRVSE